MDNEFKKEDMIENEDAEVEAEEVETDTDDEKEITDKKEKKKSMKSELMEWAVAIVIAVVVAFVIRTFFFCLVAVDGNSMNNTLQHKERLVISKFNYTPKQGDIIVFTPDFHPNTPFIKRVIATEGQTVDIVYDANGNNGIVYVDGKELDETYINAKTSDGGNVQFPITVPKDCVFVMGDNRTPGGSHDGRSVDVSSINENPSAGDIKTQVTYHNTEKGTIETREEYLYYGCVHKDDIMGKAVFRFWPLDNFGTLK